MSSRGGTSDDDDDSDDSSKPPKSTTSRHGALSSFVVAVNEHAAQEALDNELRLGFSLSRDSIGGSMGSRVPSPDSVDDMLHEAGAGVGVGAKEGDETRGFVEQKPSRYSVKRMDTRAASVSPTAVGITVAPPTIADLTHVISTWIASSRQHETNHRTAAQVYLAKYSRVMFPLIFLTTLVASLSSIDALTVITIPESNSPALRWILFGIALLNFLCTFTLLLLRMLQSQLWGYDARAHLHSARAKVLGQFRLRCERAMTNVQRATMRDQPTHALETYEVLMSARLKLLEEPILLVLPEHPNIKPCVEATPLLVPHMPHLPLAGDLKTRGSNGGINAMSSTMRAHVRERFRALLRQVSESSDTSRHNRRRILHPSTSTEMVHSTNAIMQRWIDEESAKARQLAKEAARLTRSARWWGIAMVVPQVLAGLGSTHLVSANSANVLEPSATLSDEEGGHTATFLSGIGVTTMMIAYRSMQAIRGQLHLRERATNTAEHSKQLRDFVDQAQLFQQTARDMDSKTCYAQLNMLVETRKSIRESFHLAPQN